MPTLVVCKKASAALRIGIVREYFAQGVDENVAGAVHESLKKLEAAGACLIDISLPTSAYAIPAYYIIAPAEASSNLARYDGVRYGHRAENVQSLQSLYSQSRERKDLGLRSSVEYRLGTYVLSSGYYDAYYLRAQRVRRLIVNDFARAFQSVDVLAGPTAPAIAFKQGEKSGINPLAMYAADVNTVAVNLAGTTSHFITSRVCSSNARRC